MRIYICWRNILKMIESLLSIKGVIRTDIKINENTSEVLDQDQTDDVS